MRRSLENIIKETFNKPKIKKLVKRPKQVSNSISGTEQELIISTLSFGLFWKNLTESA